MLEGIFFNFLVRVLQHLLCGDFSQVAYFANFGILATFVRYEIFVKREFIKVIYWGEAQVCTVDLLAKITNKKLMTTFPLGWKSWDRQIRWVSESLSDFHLYNSNPTPWLDFFPKLLPRTRNNSRKSWMMGGVEFLARLVIVWEILRLSPYSQSIARRNISPIIHFGVIVILSS